MVHGIDGATTPLEVAPRAGATQSERLLAYVNQVVVVVSSIALVIAALVLTYSVATRYFLHLSTDWQDEISVFLIVGAVFMSAAAIQAHRGHVAIEAIVGLLPARVNRVRLLLVDVASLVFCAFFAWKAWILLDEAIVENYHSSSTWGPPMWIPYSLMTAGMALLSLQLLLQIIAELSGRRDAEQVAAEHGRTMRESAVHESAVLERTGLESAQRESAKREGAQ
jgi:TRAP-type C4-dicarboxylate transport system permease small subunit